MSTVDEILASGRYMDRRGREWDYAKTIDAWSAQEIGYEGVRWRYRYIRLHQMRLLIERDLHRDECEGLLHCSNHPVPSVIAGYERDETFEVFNIGGFVALSFHRNLPEAMDAARRLAVEE